MGSVLRNLTAVVAFGVLAGAGVVQAGPSDPVGRCGGPHGGGCRPSEYCRVDPPFGVDKTGVCVQRPNRCPRPVGHEAVCGRNGQTYESRCFAAKAGVDVASNGVCRRTWRPGPPH